VDNFKNSRIPLIFQGNNPVFLIFCILVLVKIIISLFFRYPWIFADETVYAETARNILQGEFFSHLTYCQTYPPGYSLFLSPAYIVSENPFTSYHVMLTINAIITSSIVFPAYFLLNKFCPKFYSITGSLFIGILPSAIAYTFVVMSENLFIPLFFFSIWFLIEFFDSRSIWWGFLSGFSLFLLFFTRTLGVAMIFGFFVALLYYIIRQQGSRDFYTILKDVSFPVAGFCVPVILWSYYKLNIGGNVISAYKNEEYLVSISSVLSGYEPSIQYLQLMLHELEFLILSSYLILFTFAIYWIIILIHRGMDENQGLENISLLAFQSSALYVFVSSLITVGITVVHMFNALDKGFFLSYQIFGRYIDPLVPIIVLVGLIGFYHATTRNFTERISLIWFILVTNAVMLILLFFDLPHSNYKFPNMFGIYYIQNISNINLSFSLFIILFVFIITVFSFLSIFYPKKWYILLLILAFFSLYAVVSVTQEQYSYSIANEVNSPVIGYLVNHSDESTNVLMKTEEYHAEYGSRTWFSTQFFIKGLMIQNISDSVAPPSLFILTREVMPNNLLALSKTGFKLYDQTERKPGSINLPYTINIGSESEDKMGSFYPSETNHSAWTRAISTVEIAFPKDCGDMIIVLTVDSGRSDKNMTDVVYSLNNRIIANENFYGFRKFEYIVPQRFLNDYYQYLKIDTETWKPSDYGSKDIRSLGIRVINISVSNRILGNLSAFPDNCN